jgi:hypothetical protein
MPRCEAARREVVIPAEILIPDEARAAGLGSPPVVGRDQDNDSGEENAARHNLQAGYHNSWQFAEKPGSDTHFAT